MDDDALIDTVREWVATAQRITVLTGAGLSTDSGIPDFRGPNGVWTRNPGAEKMATLQHYLADPEVRRRAWQSRLGSPAFGAEPNAGHRAIAALDDRGVLEAVVTQNVDGLHQKAGTPEHKVIEVHGTLWWTRCWECGDRRMMEETLERVRAGEDDPPCLVCGGILKSDTISFGQRLDEEVMGRAFDAGQRSDLLIAAGSTLSVFPAANIVPYAQSCGARIVIANGDPTEMDGLADAVVRGRLGDTLPAMLAPVS